MTAMATSTVPRRDQILDRVLLDFETAAADLPEAVVPQAARRRAARELARLGWPHARDEQWRYANLRALERITAFAPARQGAAAAPEVPAALLPLPLPGFERLVFVDGVRVAGAAHAAARRAAEPMAASEEDSWTPEQRLGLLGEMFCPGRGGATHHRTGVDRGPVPDQ